MEKYHRTYNSDSQAISPSHLMIQSNSISGSGQDQSVQSGIFTKTNICFDIANKLHSKRMKLREGWSGDDNLWQVQVTGGKDNNISSLSAFYLISPWRFREDYPLDCLKNVSPHNKRGERKFIICIRDRNVRH